MNERVYTLPIKGGHKIEPQTHAKSLIVKFGRVPDSYNPENKPEKTCPTCGSDLHRRIKKPLTSKQADVLENIRSHISAYGHAPTLQYLASFYGNAVSSIWAVVDQLEKKGHIKKTPRNWKAMEIIE